MGEGDFDEAMSPQVGGAGGWGRQMGMPVGPAQRALQQQGYSLPPPPGQGMGGMGMSRSHSYQGPQYYDSFGGGSTAHYQQEVHSDAYGSLSYYAEPRARSASPAMHPGMGPRSYSMPLAPQQQGPVFSGVDAYGNQMGDPYAYQDGGYAHAGIEQSSPYASPQQFPVRQAAVYSSSLHASPQPGVRRPVQRTSSYADQSPRARHVYPTFPTVPSSSPALPSRMAPAHHYSHGIPPTPASSVAVLPSHHSTASSVGSLYAPTFGTDDPDAAHRAEHGFGHGQGAFATLTRRASFDLPGGGAAGLAGLRAASASPQMGFGHETGGGVGLGMEGVSFEGMGGKGAQLASPPSEEGRGPFAVGMEAAY